MNYSDAIRLLAKSRMDETNARAVVEVLENLYADEIGKCNEALIELRSIQEQSQAEYQKLSLLYEQLRSELAASTATLRSETARSTSSIEVSVAKLQTELSGRINDKIHSVVLIVVGLLSLACAASSSITAFLAHH